MADWKDILNDDERPLSEDDLLQYINAQTVAADKQQIEQIATDDFEKDALEGLQKLQVPGDAPKHVTLLKQHLKKQLRSKKIKKRLKKRDDMKWILFAAIMLLITCVLAYVVIKMKG